MRLFICSQNDWGTLRGGGIVLKRDAGAENGVGSNCGRDRERVEIEREVEGVVGNE